MHPSSPFAGKSIWVTGGAGYLGSAIVEELDRQAARVVCIDLPGRAEALIRDRRLTSTTAAAIDVNQAGPLLAGIEALKERHGVPDGIAHLSFASSGGKSLQELSTAELQATFERSLAPTIELCRHSAEWMKARGRGSIVLFSSMYGVVSPDPRVYQPPMAVNPIDYGASKAAILQIMRYLAVAYGPSGIRFNCVTPGPFPNPSVRSQHPEFVARLDAKTPLGRVGTNHEIVAPTLFLLSDGASFVTGHNLVVDGGWTAW